MKKLLSMVLLLGAFIQLTEKGTGQDKIYTATGKTINCDITRISSDTLYFNIRINRNVSSTYGKLEDIKDYHLGEIEKLRMEFDTASFFSIKLEDGSSLMGKIKSMDKSKVIYDDNNLGKVTIKGETIISFTKENKEAYYLVTLNDGNELYGRIKERRKDELDFQTKNLGKVTIPVKNIKQMQEVKDGKVIRGKYWFPNPNNTRYLFSPTAINLKKGEGYYQNAYVLSNSANYGLSDNFSIGGGVFLPVAAFLTPKLGFKITEKLHAGAGSIIGLFPGPTNVGILYGVTTYGSNEHNITAGAGYGFWDNEFMNSPFLAFSGMTRVDRRVALVTESWGIPFTNYKYVNGREVKTIEYFILISYGIRIMKEKVTFDIALINNKNIIEFIPLGIPYIDFVYKF